MQISNCASNFHLEFFILINLLIYFLSEREMFVLVNEDEHRTNSRRCLFLSFGTVISPNCLYELPLVLMKNVKTRYTSYSERKL